MPAQQQGADTGQGLQTHQLPTQQCTRGRAGGSGVEWRQRLGLTSRGKNQPKDGEETQGTRERHLWGKWELGSAMLSERQAQGNPGG